MERRVAQVAATSLQAARSAHVYARKAADKLRPALEAVLRPGEELPDVALFVELIGRVLQEGRAELTAAGRAHGRGRLHRRQLRDQRDQRKAELYTCLVQIRHIVRRAFPGVANFFALSGRISRDGTALLLVSRQAIADLEYGRTGGWHGGPMVGIGFDFAVHADRLRAATDRLAAADAELVDATRGTLKTMAHKDRTLERHRIDLSRYAGILESILLAADLAKLARSVRPRRRRSGAAKKAVAAEPAQAAEAATEGIVHEGNPEPPERQEA